MPGYFCLTRFYFCLIVATLIAAPLVACNNDPLVIPTQVPVAALPTASPTTLPPTRDLNQPTSPATSATPASSPTPRPPTATPTRTDVWVRVAVPEEGAALLMGSDVILRGLMQRNPEETVWVSLFSATGRLLVETQARLGENSWEAGFTVPEAVSGTAFLEATLRDAAGELLAAHRIRVELALDAATSERFLVLMQPLVEETAVAGFNILFTGQTLLPAGNVITVEVWADCEDRVAQQSFVMGRSGRSFPWQGFLVVPQDIVPGTACAIARAGEPGTENWREAGRLITILAQDNPEARGIRLGFPPANATIMAGETLSLYGTALNVSEGPVTVSIALDNGRAIGQVSATSDYWGYWETTIGIPVDVTGQAQITITAGDPDDDNYSETTTLVTINPAPTPTAVPPLPTPTPAP